METSGQLKAYESQAQGQESANGHLVDPADIALSSISELVTQARKENAPELVEFVVISSELAEAPSGKARLSAVYVTELNYLSLGYKIKESTHLQNAKYETVNSRRAKLKKKLGAQTMPQAVILGIQQGFIDITHDKEPFADHLSPMGRQTLHLIALGWTVEQIADRYNISYYSAAGYRGEIREKLGAKAITHAMRRAFEVGIFKKDEPIMDIDSLAEDADADLQINLGGKVFEPHHIGIASPTEIEVLNLISKLQKNIFNAPDLYSLGFYENAPSNRARSKVLGDAMREIMAKFNSAYGETVLEQVADRPVLFAFLKSYSIGPGDSIQVVTAANAEEIEKAVKSQKRPYRPSDSKKRNRRIVKKVVRPPDPIIERLEASWPEDKLDPEKLPALNLEFFANTVPRDPKEVLEDQSIKLAVASIAGKNILDDYRSKVIVALRYGVRPTSDSFSIHRPEGYISVEEIMRNIPPFQGLEIDGVSSISGLAPHAVLLAEKKLIDRHQEQYPALRKLLPTINSQLSAMRNQLAEDSSYS